MICTTRAKIEPAEVDARPWRYAWRKRYWKGALLGVVLLVTLRGAWGWLAERRWQQTLGGIRARGEPITPDDLDLEPVPEEDNAALLLIKAAEALDDSALSALSDRLGLSLARTPLQLTADEWQTLHTLGQLNAPAFALVRRARGLPSAHWGIGMGVAFSGAGMMPYLSPQRQLTQLLTLRALDLHHRGQDQEALATMADVLAQSSRLDSHPALITHLTALATCQLAVHRLQAIVPDLRIGLPPAAPAEDVRDLIRRLLDDDWLSEGLQQAILVERAFILQFGDQLRSGQTSASLWPSMGRTFEDRLRALAFGPLIQLNQISLITYMDPFCQAAAQPTLPEARTMFAQLKPPQRRAYWALLVPSLRTAVLINHHLRTDRRLGAVALAIRLYENDHGHRPDTLAELVPQYLTEVPADPMAADGRALGYFPDDPYPRLSSVGDDGADDGGNWKRVPQQATREDHVWFLDEHPSEPAERP